MPLNDESLLPVAPKSPEHVPCFVCGEHIDMNRQDSAMITCSQDCARVYYQASKFEYHMIEITDKLEQMRVLLDMMKLYG